jgi:hypothetical protein
LGIIKPLPFSNILPLPVTVLSITQPTGFNPLGEVLAVLPPLLTALFFGLDWMLFWGTYRDEVVKGCPPIFRSTLMGRIILPGQESLRITVGFLNISVVDLGLFSLSLLSLATSLCSCSSVD